MRVARLLSVGALALGLSACVDYGAEGYVATPAYAAPGGYGGYAAIRSVDDFTAPLAQYGRWVTTRWGNGWVPAVGPDWRPYTVGQWIDDPAYGWTWASEEPWGWATYHFGRWGFDAQIGWVWIPDTEWAPAWVAWRDGDDVTGWAPLPPRVVVSYGVSFGYGSNAWDYDRWYGPSWVYVPRGQFGHARQRYSILPQDRGRDYWNHSRDATRYDRDGGRVVNNSLGRDRSDRDGNYRPRPTVAGAYIPNQRPTQGYGGNPPQDSRTQDNHRPDGSSGWTPPNGATGCSSHGRGNADNGNPCTGNPGYGRPGYTQPAPGGVGQSQTPPGWSAQPGGNASGTAQGRPAYAARPAPGSAAPNLPQGYGGRTDGQYTGRGNTPGDSGASRQAMTTPAPQQMRSPAPQMAAPPPRPAPAERPQRESGEHKADQP